MTDNYESFIATKAHSEVFPGIEDDDFHGDLFPHQRDLVRWALRKGRAAIFAQTGLGKTAMQVEWAKHVSRRGRVLILAPLAVAQQTSKEASTMWGVDVPYRREDNDDQITITNYEMMDRFDPSLFIGVVLDESSILKSFDGKTRNAIIEVFKSTPFKLAATATPAPNDFTELGNHSEFLGVKTRVEMLAEYFVHDMAKTQDWRLKGHAISSFWRWVSTWGAVLRMPSDLGYEDGAYSLPPLRFHEHVLSVDHRDAHKSGMLFATNASTLSDQRSIRRATLEKRIQKAVEIVGDDPSPCIIWCELNDESVGVSKAIRGAVEVTGSDSIDVKQEMLSSFSSGLFRVMVSKTSIAGFGLNWQHCARMIFIGASHSYEQTYQAIRRCWRFGQTKPVDVHIIRAETEQLVIDNYRRKEAEAERLGAEMAAHLIDSVRAEVQGASAREWNPYNANTEMTIPSWMSSDNEGTGQ